MGRYVFKLPDVGEGTAEAELVEWKVKAGDAVEEDQPLADVMTDKATVELTSPVAGTVTRTNGQPGEMLAVGSPFVEFEVEGAGNAPASDQGSSSGSAGEGDRSAQPSGGGGAGSQPSASQEAHLVHSDAEAAAISASDSADSAAGAAQSGSDSSDSTDSFSESASAGGNYVFKLPDVGEGTAEAELVEWKVAVGDAVSEDQPLADVMTDKATVELTSPVAGTVVALTGAPGQMLAVGSPFVRLQVEGKGNVAAGQGSGSSSAERGRGTAEGGGGGESQAQPSSGSQSAKPSTPQPAPKPQAASAARAPSTASRSPSPAGGGGTPARETVERVAGERPLASPAVRKRAHDLGVPLQFVPGSGPGGRIGHEDLDAYVSSGGRQAQASGGGSGPSTAPRTGVNDVKIIGMRRRIAQQMQESKRHIPHITYVEEIDGTELDALRVHLNATKRADRPKLTLLPFFIKAMVKVLPDFPQINARYDDEAGVLHQFEGIHVGIATQGPNGLLVPVVRHAETLDVWQIASEIARVSGAAKDGSAKKEELTGSTITLTSLGTLGGVVHTPIVNWPEVAIVGPNKLIERPVVQNGQVAVRKMMNLSSSFDHRIVDGYDAASFVQRLKGLLEHPASLFVE